MIDIIEDCAEKVLGGKTGSKSGKPNFGFRDDATQEQIKEIQDAAFEAIAEPLYAVKLGIEYLNGGIVKQNYNQAFRWYKFAAESGFPLGQANLADCYMQGWGVKRNVEEAVRWTKEAASNGFGNSQLCLGKWYIKGDYVDQDIEEGERLLRLAAAHDESDPFVKIGVMKLDEAYETLGISLTWHNDTASKREGLKWLTKAAERGYTRSIEILFHIYKGDVDCMKEFKDITQAVKWAKRL
jgi:hypothetical protein